MDVKSVFFNSDFCEEIYMQNPPSFIAISETSILVCKLSKYLYGLKQRPRAWFDQIDLISWRMVLRGVYKILILNIN